jgi:hypothetical protein
VEKAIKQNFPNFDFNNVHYAGIEPTVKAIYSNVTETMGPEVAEVMRAA